MVYIVLGAKKVPNHSHFMQCEHTQKAVLPPIVLTMTKSCSGPKVPYLEKPIHFTLNIMASENRISCEKQQIPRPLCLLSYKPLTIMECKMTHKFNAEHERSLSRQKFHFLAFGKRVKNHHHAMLKCFNIYINITSLRLMPFINYL